MARIIWHVLNDRTPYQDLGADFYTQRQDPEHEKNHLIAKLQALGYQITAQPAA